MPIRPELKACYPPDWDAISREIRFNRAGGRCERCGRKHNRHVYVAGDELIWIDPETGYCYSGLDGCRLGAYSGGVDPEQDAIPPDWPAGHMTLTILTCAHLDQDPSNNDRFNLAALCQRCHLRHDAYQHAATARLTRHNRLAVGDLFEDEG